MLNLYGAVVVVKWLARSACDKSCVRILLPPKLLSDNLLVFNCSVLEAHSENLLAKTLALVGFNTHCLWILKNLNFYNYVWKNVSVLSYHRIG